MSQRASAVSSGSSCVLSHWRCVLCHLLPRWSCTSRAWRQRRRARDFRRAASSWGCWSRWPGGRVRHAWLLPCNNRHGLKCFLGESLTAARTGQRETARLLTMLSLQRRMKDGERRGGAESRESSCGHRPDLKGEPRGEGEGTRTPSHRACSQVDSDRFCHPAAQPCRCCCSTASTDLQDILRRLPERQRCCASRSSPQASSASPMHLRGSTTHAVTATRRAAGSMKTSSSRERAAPSAFRT